MNSYHHFNDMPIGLSWNIIMLLCANRGKIKHFSTHLCYVQSNHMSKSSVSAACLFCRHVDHILRRRQTTATVSSSLQQADSAGTAAGMYWLLWSEVQWSRPREACPPGRWHPGDLKHVQYPRNTYVHILIVTMQNDIFNIISGFL